MSSQMEGIYKCSQFILEITKAKTSIAVPFFSS